jgi:hypothetical protein
VYHSLFKDIERWNAIDLSKSAEVFFGRLDKEGFSFASRLIPELGKSLDAVLSGGTWVRPKMFKAKTNSDVRPALFHELFSLVLNDKGEELDNPSITAVKDIRQIAGLFYKYEMPIDKDMIDRTWSQMIETDESLGKPELSDDLKKVIHLSRTLLAELLHGVNPKTGIPGHGPGAVSEGYENWVKSSFHDQPTQKALNYFGWEYFFSNPKDIERSMSKHGHVTLTGKVSKPYSKFACVPKDSRGPRTICEEGVFNQYLQQGIKNLLYELIEGHPLTAGHVNFTDQTINGSLALWGSSIERDIVTLDMKEASNRITWWLVKLLFPPSWVDALDATRSECVQHGNRTVAVNMYAPMGSALCFPIESLVHWSIAVSSLVLIYGYELDDVLSGVYVYGDDIVLRGLPYKGLFYVFEKLKMKFNQGKCCTGGRFRESCGTDAYRGEHVNPLRIKKPILSSGSASDLVAAVSYANTAFNDGLHELAGCLQELISELWHTKIPYVIENSDVIGYTSSRLNATPGLNRHAKVRFNRHWHVCEAQGVMIRGKKFKGNTDWCRYRDTLRTLAKRQGSEIGKFDFLFSETQHNAESESDVFNRPTHRHSSFLAKTWSSSIISY